MTAFIRLSKEEKVAVDAHSHHNMSAIAIKKTIERHNFTIDMYFRAKFQCSRTKTSGRSSNVMAIWKGQLCKWTYHKRNLHQQRRRALKVHVSTGRLQQIQKTHKYTEYVIRQKSPALTEDHKDKGVLWKNANGKGMIGHL